MSGPEDVAVRRGNRQDIAELLAFWALAGENQGRPADQAALVEALLAPDPEALIVADAIRFDAMVLTSNSAGSGAWQALGYEPQEDWTRWIKPA